MEDSLDIMRMEQQNRNTMKNNKQNKSQEKHIIGIKSATQTIVEEHHDSLELYERQQFGNSKLSNSNLLQASKQQSQHLNKTPFFGDQAPKVKHYQKQQGNLQIKDKQSLQQNQSSHQQIQIKSKNSQQEQQIEEPHQQPGLQGEQAQQNILIAAVNKIFKKSTQALQQFQQGFHNIQIQIAENEQTQMKCQKQQQQIEEQQSIIQRIASKTFEGLKQFQQNFNKIQVEQQSIKRDHKVIEEDNQFMAQQFGSNQRLEEVKKYVDGLKSQAVNQHLLNQAMREQAIQNFIEKLFKNRQHFDFRMINTCFSLIKQQKIQTPDNQQSNLKKQKQRVGSANVQNRMSSAQSQRLKSALSRKSSENQQSFNLDLTVKTKGSKNPYKIGKLDSLMYSQQSDFGFHPNSPTKSKRAGHENSDSNKSVLQKPDDLIAQSKRQSEVAHNKSNLRKSYSQRVQMQNKQAQKDKAKRLLSFKQNRQQFHVNQHENQQDENEDVKQQQLVKQTQQQNNSYAYNDENAQHKDNFFRAEEISQSAKTNKENSQEDKGVFDDQKFDQKNHEAREREQLNNYSFKQKQDEDNNPKQAKKKHKKTSKQKEEQGQRYSKNDRKQINHSLHHKNSPKKKQKYRHHDSDQKEYENQQTSVKDGTLIDQMQNFDADDQQGQVEQKQLAQSAHFAKKKNTQHLIRKRVETEIGKKEKQPLKHDFSKKNIKRFNKIDLTKLEQQSQPSKSRAISHHNSQSNIFATEINNYQKKIQKIKQQKQLKKKRLEDQLSKINQQLQVLNLKQQQLSPNNKNNYASRVKISDNTQAQKKAQSLVKNLRSQKRNRNLAKLGQFKSIDKNINQYMEQLTHLRSQNEEKLKQRKKIQILERMKQNQMRKMNEKKKIQQNQQFVLQLKGSGGTTIAKPQVQKIEVSKRNNIRQKQIQQQQPITDLKNLTPELNQKKAYLNKLRHFSVKKPSRVDAYQQLLG